MSDEREVRALFDLSTAHHLHDGSMLVLTRFVACTLGELFPDI